MTAMEPGASSAEAGPPTVSRPEGGRLAVAVVNGSPSRRSKTVGLTELISEVLADVLAEDGIEVEMSRIDVYGLGPGLNGAREREDVSEAAEAALRRVETADLVIAATPVFRGSYTGMFKHFFDLIDQYALANTPVLLAATGGGEHHALVLEHAMRPLFGFFQAMTVPVAVFASSADFDGTVPLTPRIHGRVETAITDVRPILLGRVRRSASTRPRG
ncbi:NAD(P)H-dependent oxidoreductase [Microbacterium soli]|uniref:FMN reductase n=1 Tax=Microbacterium soli TaxID=446075 RepID=A0ABP7MXP6_9MICO